MPKAFMKGDFTDRQIQAFKLLINTVRSDRLGLLEFRLDDKPIAIVVDRGAKHEDGTLALFPVAVLLEPNLLEALAGRLKGTNGEEIHTGDFDMDKPVSLQDIKNQKS